jgi:hypothetical protein
MSAFDKIRQAFPELADASDSEVLGEAARRTGVSVAQLSDTLGIAPRSTFGEAARQFGAGLIVDAPRMAGQALKYYSSPGGERVGEGAFPRLGRATGLERQYGVEVTEPAPGYTAGQALVESADVRGRGMEPDLRGRGALGEALVTGARGVGGIVPTLGLMAVPGGQVLAPALQAALFGGSSAQDSYEKLIEQGVPEEEAAAAARRVWGVQGVGEGVATAGLGALFRPAIAAARGARSTSGVAQSLTNTDVLKPFVKGMALNVPLQAGTEAAQDVGTELVERAYGAKPEDIGDIARGSALAGAGMTLLLGPLALGGSITRARRAQSLKDALYNPDTPVETRAKAMDLVMGEARRQGVAEQDVDTWFNQQLELEDARTAALRAAEKAESEKQINLLGEKAQQLEGLQDGMFSSLEQQRAFEQGLAGVDIQTPFSSLEQQKAFTQGLETARDNNIARVGQQYQDLMGDRASTLMQAQDVGQQAQGILEPQRRGLETAQRVGEQWQEIRAGKSRVMMDIDDMGQEWQKLSKELPQPVTGELSRAQKAALRGPEGKRLKRTSSPFTATGGGPMATTLLEPVQNTLPVAATPAPAPAPSSLLSERPAAVEPAEPITPVGASEAVAAALPAAQPAAGVSSTVTTGAPSGTQASQTKQTKTQRAKAPAAPATTVVTEEEDKPLAKLLQDVDSVDVGNPLPASVRGAQTVKAPGRTSMTTVMLKKVRDALLRPSGKVGKGAGEQEQRIVDALGNFASAYKTYLDQGGQTVSRRNKLPKSKTAAEFAQGQVSGVEVQAANVQAALAELGQAVGGNAKDIEAVVRLVKDMVQGKIIAPGRTRAEVIQAGKKLDTMLSQAWAAAKRETFMRETPDVADVRGGVVRVAKEQQGEMPPLQKAATEGVANPKGKGERYFGLQAVLQYIRNSGTPFERMLASTLRDVIGDQMNDVKLEFITEGDPRFDPKTNTVYLRSNESPEVALHEALHAALQSFIYKNPKDPMVMQLKRSLKAVVGYKGELTGKAKEVQDLLKKLVAEKNELDAVLELVSYGTTLNDFRKALEAMPSKGVPASFRESVSNVWRYIKAVMARMLNKPNTVAADVLDTSIALLEKASKEARVPNSGKVLEAAVQTNKPVSNEKAAAALGVPAVDYTRWQEKNLVNVFSTQRLFEAVGWSEEGMVGKGVDKLAGWARETAKKYPSAEIIAGLLNSRYNVNRDVSNIQDNYKYDKNVGYQVAERIANYISGQPAEQVNAVFAYLDGNKRALDGVNDGGKLKGLADNMKKWFDIYVAELSPVEQKFFNSRKFSENLLFPSRTEEIARNQFGLGKINAVLGKKSISESEIDQNWFTKTADGDVVLDGDFYQVFKTANTLKGKPESAGFMSAAKFKELGEKDPMGFAVDTTRRWVLEAGDADKGKFKFTTNTTVREKIADEKADDLANALRNTMAALANNYASKNFISAMAKMGTENSPYPRVAFDSVEQINKEYGTQLQEGDDRILSVSEEMSRSEKTRDLYRMSGTWVQLPKSDVYGDLAGKYLPGPVWNSMIDMYSRQPVVDIRAVNNTMRWFKKSKTVYNPGTHVTNAASNITMAMMHDISFKTMRDATKLLYRYEFSPKSLTVQERTMVEQFINSGAMLGDFSSTEVKEALYQAQENNLRNGNDDSLLTRVAGYLGIEKSKAEFIDKYVNKGTKGALSADELVSQIYAFEDNAFRMAAFMKTVGQEQLKAGAKAPTEEMFRTAGKFALKAFGDYDIDSKAVKALRQTVMPFISWGYAMGPMIGRMVLMQPWKIANVLMAYYLLEAAMSGAADGDDEEIRKSGPENIRERMFFGAVGPYMHVRIPFMGDDQNPVYYKLGDYFPVASMTKGLPNGFMGQSWFPSMITPSGPFVSAIASVVLGIDTYTGKSIHQPTDTEWQKLWNSTKAGYDIFAPPAINSKQINRANDFFEGKEGVTGTPPSGLVFARAFGLKMYDYNVPEEEAKQELNAERVQREFKAAMSKAKRDEYRKGYPDYEALDKELEDLQERMEKEMAKKRGEE